MGSRPRLRPAYAILALLLMFATACTALPPLFPGPETAQAPAPMQASEAMTTITGEVTYLQRIALQPDAVVEVELQDVSRADAPAIVVGSQRIETQGAQVPIPFSLEYDPTGIDPRMTYAVSARITEDGKLTWINTTMHPVLTRGAPANNVEIVVQPVK